MLVFNKTGINLGGEGNGKSFNQSFCFFATNGGRSSETKAY